MAENSDFKVKHGLVVSEDIELGHATDTTIARSSSGNISVEGNLIYRAGGTDVPVSDGGTNASSFADKSVIISQDSGTDTLAALALTTSGQLVIGGASGPAAATLTAGSNVTITNADGGITIAASGGGSVGGSDTEILYNNGGTEDGIASFTYTDTGGAEAFSMSASSSADLVTITQTGAGLAFRVEDAASPDSSSFVVTATGIVGVRTATPNAGYGFHVNDKVLHEVSHSTSGSASSPSFSFSTDTNTGMYRVGADQLGFSTAGTLALTIGSSGEVTIPGQMTSRANVVAVTGTTQLTLAQSGSYVYVTDSGAVELPDSATTGTQYTIFNNKGSDLTVTLGDGSMASSWAGVAAVADNDATSFVCVSAGNWVQVGA